MFPTFGIFLSYLDIATPPDLEAWTRRAEIMKCCDKVKKYDKVNNSWSVVKRLPVRADSSYGWGLAFKACGNSLLVIGAGGHGGHDDGVIVLHSWNPDEGNRDGQGWNVLAVNAQAGTFVYNCAVMGC
ncbi:F-box/kelch-repeat protein At5g60570 isoform X1 [Gossypium hirsutum]|uniref:F-box/kelch-repeat protein At5g60570 isoform X1 n=1 Tax=Gossypium hirsutum TaxID=3635 RepID=A0A1U8KSH5_GOSHI|nr:F-box/kelch-repeat protein At5g60570-like isoform X1 [Gossypium hirsutum]XP_040964827.1 F-box/kelch-repeat protein At5g60570-like isoform X1 [Gossypium hirsutum]